MKNIAFIYTEYQQNILFAICLQEKIQIDIIFVRNNIVIQDDIFTVVHKIVYYEDTSFSWRSVWKYHRVYKKAISPCLDENSSYRIFTWTIVGPIARYAINLTQCVNIDLIEDGSGSYIKNGLYNYNQGFKTFAVSTFVFWFTNIFSMSLLPLKCSYIKGWSLYDNCYPDFNIKKNIIEHKNFQKVIRNSLDEKSKNLDVESNAVMIITSPYVEFGILSENEYIQIMIQLIEKIKQHKKENIKTIYWKLHPRTNIKDEKIRLAQIQTITNTNVKILYADSNIELIALVNQEKYLQYYSLGSSSLYVIKSLVPEDTVICLVESKNLTNKLKAQSELNKLYEWIGIEII